MGSGGGSGTDHHGSGNVADNNSDRGRGDGEGLIASRSEFQAALRLAFEQAADAGCRELWLVDDDFADWPLGERAVVDQLQRWAASSRRLTLVARTFDEVARHHARWVAWRRPWSHIVSCRANHEFEAGEMPTLLLAPRTVSVRMTNVERYRGRVATDLAEESRCRQVVEAVLQRSQEAFAVTTTGL